MLREDLFCLRDACCAVGALAELAAISPAPPPNERELTPIERIQQRFSRSDDDLTAELHSLSLAMARHAEQIGVALDWDEWPRECRVQEAKRQLSLTANLAGELLRRRRGAVSDTGVLAGAC